MRGTTESDDEEQSQQGLKPESCIQEAISTGKKADKSDDTEAPVVAQAKIKRKAAKAKPAAKEEKKKIITHF